MVTGLWYTHDLNFGSLSLFQKCKEHPCPLSHHLGLWRMLEVPDGFGILILIGIWWLVFYISKIRFLALYIDFEGAKNIHVLQVLIRCFGGCWRILIGVCNLDLWMIMDFLVSLMFPQSFNLVAEPRAEKLVSPGRVWSGRVWSGLVWFLQKIIPLRGSILQARTCQILSLAENPRWSRVWQYCIQYCV